MKKSRTRYALYRAIQYPLTVLGAILFTFIFSGRFIEQLKESYISIIIWTLALYLLSFIFFWIEYGMSKNK
ncbi:hypothetical protein [Porphyromonas sp. COT-108 OH1349]|uniref:hypothetical protein n=1 Tax=Porphyromonas sp. COT-108 OH1349 TaxID=1537504 RepID=UPI00052DA8C9|nr:hypothetical protein [Porphyromonas sp. COT-108 OH1349]KGN67850.1 hypothetical protein JT26_07870 [Porphyromonas sp. COT-108 OH1349]